MRQKSGPEKQPAEDAIRDIRRATRRHFSAEEKIRVVLEGLRGEESIAELCRREGIASSMYYGWSKEFLEAGKRRLAGDTARAATSDEVKDLRREAQASPPCGRTCGRPAQLDDSPPSRRDRSARGRAHQPFELSKALRKKVPLGRPRHTLKGRQTESEVERVGLRLQLRRQQAEAGDIVLLYGDESEALTHLSRAWAKSGADLGVPAPGKAKKVAMLGSLDHVTRRLVLQLPAR